MLNIDWHVESCAGVSLVTCVVENPTRTPRRARIANRLDGPVQPPRREGVPEAGWDDGGFEGVIAAGETRPLGYASPAPPDDPAVELVWTERAGTTECDAGPGFRGQSTPEYQAIPEDHATEDHATEDHPTETQATPESVVRALGDARPPADAIPTSTVVREASFATPGDGSDLEIPDAVASWLTAVEERATCGDDCAPTCGDDCAPASEDSAALGAVARKVDALRASDAKSPSTDRRRSL